MKKSKEQYVRPSVIELEYQVDMTVRLSNCKTTTGTNSGQAQCGANLVPVPCSSIGS